MNPKLLGIITWIYFALLPLMCAGALLLAAPLRWVRLRFQRRTNSLWAGTPILTLPLKARAERRLGANAKTLVYSSYGIARHGFDFHLGRWVRSKALGWPVPIGVFFWACVTQDRLHFFCDQALLPSHRRQVHSYELAAYRLLGIHLFFWVYGADVRTRQRTLALGEPNCCTFCPEIGRHCICDAVRGRKNYGVIRKYATAVFSMGDMLHYTPGSINDLFFWPVEMPETGAEGQGGSRQGLRIVHAANHRMFKGTRFLIQAVENLRKQGYLVELVLVENVSNDQALRIYQSADLIFDQCLIGFHGYFALEAMALGKPVMCFIRDEELYLCHPEECPIVNVTVDTIEDRIVELYDNRPCLTELGQDGKTYARKYFTIEAFSSRLDHAYRKLGVSAK